MYGTQCKAPAAVAIANAGWWTGLTGPSDVLAQMMAQIANSSTANVRKHCGLATTGPLAMPKMRFLQQLGAWRGR